MNRILPKIWIAYLVLLPLNPTYFLGAGPALPADLALLPLLALGFPSLRRNLWQIVRSDYPVALYFLLFAVSAATAAAAHGLSRSLLTALAAQGSLAALYFVFRATVIEKRLIFRLAAVWVAVSMVAAAAGILFVVLGWLGWATPLARWYPNVGPGAWRLIGTLGHTPNFAYGYFHIGFFLALGLSFAVQSGEPAAVDNLLARKIVRPVLLLHSAALLLTFSRGLIGGILGMIVLAGALRKKLGRFSALYTAGLWTVFAVLFLYATVFFTYTTDALYTSSQARADSLRLDPTAAHRSIFANKNVPHLEPGARYTRLPGGLTFLPSQHWYLLEAAGHCFFEHPLFGIGPGRFIEVQAELKARGLLPPHFLELKPHSMLLGTLAESGLAGLAGLVLLWVFFLGGATRRRLMGDPLGLAVYAALAGYLVVGLNMDVLNFRWLWLLFALAAALARPLKDRTPR